MNLEAWCPQAFTRKLPEKPQPLRAPFSGERYMNCVERRNFGDREGSIYLPSTIDGVSVTWRIELDNLESLVAVPYPADQLIAYEQARQEPQK